ncbi:hypothetical protein ACHAWC_006551, partial [Mediolabrus comicus]
MTTATTSTNTSQVRVGVRIRPLTSKESSEGGRPIVQSDTLNNTVSLLPQQQKRQFTYDSVFHENVTQCDLYGDVSPLLLDAFLGGFNATVLAYGQTGSGKTYTMGSEAHHSSHNTSDDNNNSCGSSALRDDAGCTVDNALSDNDGLIPRFMRDIFTLLSQRQEASEKMLRRRRQSAGSGGKSANNNNDTVDENNYDSGGDALINFQLSASFLEVYGEDIHDLLDEERKSLPIREDSNGVIIVKGLQETPVTSDIEAMRILNQGTMNRTTASTLMNRTSSRSHAVFM